mgnify:CR=1 FL=1
MSLFSQRQFDQAARAYGADLYRYAYWLCRDRFVAEELVQEVMLKIWNRASTFDSGKASATTWIYTLARNCRIDLLRKKYRVREEVDVDELWDLGTDEDLLDPGHRRREHVAVGWERGPVTDGVRGVPLDDPEDREEDGDEPEGQALAAHST